MGNKNLTLKSIKKQSPEICLIAVQKNGWELCRVKEQTLDICLAAVLQNRRALRYVKPELRGQVEELLANEIPEQKSDLFKYVDKQATDICLTAVRQDGFALQFVKSWSPEFCIAAVQQNGMALQFAKYQSPKICLEAVKQNGEALQFVKKQTPKICLAAVKQKGYALEFVKNQTPEICMAAISQHSANLQFVKEQTPEMCLAAVKQRGYTLQFVKEQTLDICLTAVLQNSMAIRYVKPELKEQVKELRARKMSEQKEKKLIKKEKPICTCEKLQAYQDTRLTPEEIIELQQKLTMYQTAEEQGLMLRLPCKEGTFVWTIITLHDSYDDTPYKVISQIAFRLSMIHEINKTIFLTYEDAQKALLKIQNPAAFESIQYT